MTVLSLSLSTYEVFLSSYSTVVVLTRHSLFADPVLVSEGGYVLEYSQLVVNLA